jgi:hypothetical protein
MDMLSLRKFAVLWLIAGEVLFAGADDGHRREATNDYYRTQTFWGVPSGRSDDPGH